jgi:16S rRNA (adenine1518-N6/adenine1519-N6)-dimethyltransferase
VVKPKKHLGQHFLTDLSIAEQIVKALQGFGDYRTLIEIGPGTGVLTDFLLKEGLYDLHLIEIDTESVAYLSKKYPNLKSQILAEDFLEMNLEKVFPLAEFPQFGIISNFPYNISSQIFFKILDNRDRIPEVVGMLQKEVAKRLASPPKSKEYGILSVFLQAYYDIEYLFTVEPNVFNPPPKVQSGVIRLKRNEVKQLDCDERLFRQVVKAGFNQRRKTLRNALKPLNLKPGAFELPVMNQRAEELSVAAFVALTCEVLRLKA